MSAADWIPISLKPEDYQFLNLNNGDKLTDVAFIESVACNSEWDRRRQDGKAMVYFPTGAAQSGQLIIKYCDLSEAIPKVHVLMTVFKKIDSGPEYWTCFGSKLSDDGILWLCIFNANLVVGVDITTKQIIDVFQDIACPNDLCIDSNNPNLLYVAGGFGVERPVILPGCSSSDLVAALPVVGHVYRIDLTKKGVAIALLGPELHSLSGIGSLRGKLFISQLFEMRSVEQSLLSSKKSSNTKVDWTGNEVGDHGKYFLSDNITKWDDKLICVALYRKASPAQVEVMKSTTVSTVGWSCAKCFSGIFNALCLCKSYANNRLNNAELPDFLSEVDTYTDCAFFLYDVEQNKRWHYKFGTQGLDKGGQSFPFDGHCSQVQRHAGRVLFINFKSSRVLVLRDSCVPASPGA